MGAACCRCRSTLQHTHTHTHRQTAHHTSTVHIGHPLIQRPQSAHDRFYLQGTLQTYTRTHTHTYIHAHIRTHTHTHNIHVHAVDSISSEAAQAPRHAHARLLLHHPFDQTNWAREQNNLWGQGTSLTHRSVKLQDGPT